MRSGFSRLRAFVNALRALADECRLVDEEPARRRQILCSILKEAGVAQPPYLPHFFPTPRGVITKWRLNPSFGEAAVALFLKSHLPESMASYLPPGVRENFSFERMCQRLVGAELAPFNQREQPASAESPDVSARLLILLEEMAVTDSGDQQAQLAGLAAQLAVVACDAEAPRRLALWLQVCRQYAQGAANSDMIWECAIKSARGWLAAAGPDRENICRLLDLLSARSVEVFSSGWVRTVTPPEAYYSLAKLGSLALEDAIAIVDLKLVTAADKHFSGKSGQLTALLKVLTPNRRHWEGLSGELRGDWLQLFAETVDPDLAGKLADWFIHLRRERSFTFLDCCSFVRAIVNFLGRGGETERTPRESFLRQRIPLLDRILDEVEWTLRDLPATGFDQWHSHKTLWDREIGMIEVAFQWNASGYSDEPALAAELFGWSRKKTRQAIADQWSEPPDPYRKVRCNEPIVVRVSAGSRRQLLELLEYYTEAWNHPDNPFDGWQFLNRYPAAQRCFQEHCACPSRIYGAMRILRRFALAVRLQQRARLHEDLQKWVAAQSHPEPLARLRALREIAGYLKELPSSIERILARSEALRKELSTLGRMREEGRLTASAARRLSKLEILLRDEEAIASWAWQDASRAVAKKLPRTQILALDVISRRAIRTHWNEVIVPKGTASGVDWDNALHFYYSADKNKHLLRDLLRHTAEKDALWRLRHPPNVKFVEELQARGLKIESWLEPFSTIHEIHQATWKLYLEQDPLRILQMGNLFGTCLSVDDFNAFAAIANAAEINKQVLYLEDAGGVVIGRKLIGLTSDGRIFGFRSYGASCLYNLHRAERPQAWIKILFDLACLKLARRMDGQFDRSPEADQAANQLQLSAEWYNDGPEPFDWWIVRPELAGDILQENKAPVAEAVCEHIRQTGLDLRIPAHEAMPSLRAMLWLGDEAGAVIKGVGREAIPPNCARFLRCQTSSATVRELLTA